MKANIKDFDPAELEGFISELGEKPFRAKQIGTWIFAKSVCKFSEMTDLSLSFREKLEQSAEIRSTLTLVDQKESVDGTKKYLFELFDGNKIESVLIPDKNRNTLCISSQVGCAMGCTFCLTARVGKIRNLSCSEIVDQYLTINKLNSGSITNIVYMGMGEPMLNYKNVIRSAEILTDPKGIGLGKRRITISTVGVIPGIEKFTDEDQPYTLAISLNSTDDLIRAKIMPISKKYPIKELLAAANQYTDKSGKLITFEYVLIDKYNASIEDAKKLVQLTHRIPCKINVIPCNSEDREYLPPPEGKVKEFEKYINSKSRRITLRRRRGWEIQAACGQLYTKNIKKSRKQKIEQEI